MASQYLLRCDCGADLLVEPYQAGEQIACECGASLVVPALRKLRELPPAPEEAAEKQGEWSFRHGMLTAGLLLAALIGGVGGVMRAIEPPPPAEFSADKRTANFSEVIQQVTPVQAYLMWSESYQTLAKKGFAEIKSPNNERLLNELAKRHAVEKVLWAVAAAMAIGSVIAFLALGGPKQA